MKNLINGQWVDAQDGRVIQVYNPATGALLDTVPRSGAADVNTAVAFAKQGYAVNRAIPSRERARYLHKLADLMERNHDELKDVMVAENGKSQHWAHFEVTKSTEIIRVLAERPKDPVGTTYPMDSMQDCAGMMAMMYRQPRGVVGGIIPFNFPLEMVAYKVGGALSAGNAIVVKLSEDCPLTCLKLGELMLQAGVPKEAFHLLVGYGEEAGMALVDHPDVPMITFTGSSAVGKIIMEHSAKYLKHLSLELGGNDPVIVCDDADLDAVAQGLIKGRFTVGNGQACVADKRLIVDHKVLGELTEKIVNMAAGLRMGDPADPGVDVGPVINARAAERIEAMIQDAVGKGAAVRFGGKRRDNFIEPTVLSGVTKGMALYDQECFGPVVTIMESHSDEEALFIANDSPYGLEGAVFTRDISRAMKLADAMEVGGVVVNASGCFRPGNVPYMPRKESGLGTDNMFNCYEEMTTGKAIVIQNATAQFGGRLGE
ncbi:MAG: aldehyde dehydrogenase family protein [Candidatus Limiplasma sp.]|nr:aldehyde dehydrogenase family protein [Candidatus Limiplasma sp.]